MPDTSHVRIGPLHLSNTQFFAALAMLILAALEYRRLVLLDIPLQANLGSFDVLTAALANGSIFALVLAVLFLLLGIVVLIGLGLAAVLYACWLYLFAIATLARFGLFQTLRAMSKTADRHLAFELRQLARRLDLHTDKSVAMQDRMRALADDVARIEDRLIGPDGAETSAESLAGESLAGIVRLLPDLLGESLAFPIALSGLAENAEFGEFLEYGFPMRVSGVLSDVLRDSGNPELRSCLANLSDPVAVIDFPEGRTRFAPGLGPLRDLVDLTRHEAGPAVILMRGGASYTGDATKNLRLSEQRAEWVKGQFLRMLFDDRSTLPVEIALFIAYPS